jgi:hypothetical protein
MKAVVALAIFLLTFVAMAGSAPEQARHQGGKITRAKADALADSVTKSDPFLGTTPYATTDVGGVTNFYGYELVWNEPKDPTQNAGFIRINKSTGQIIVGTEICYLYPKKPGDKPVTSALGIEVPADCD